MKTPSETSSETKDKEDLKLKEGDHKLNSELEKLEKQSKGSKGSKGSKATTEITQLDDELASLGSDPEADLQKLALSLWCPPPSCYSEECRVEYYSTTFRSWIVSKMLSHEKVTNACLIAVQGKQQRGGVTFEQLRSPLRPGEKCEVYVQTSAISGMSGVMCKSPWIGPCIVVKNLDGFRGYEVKPLTAPNDTNYATSDEETNFNRENSHSSSARSSENGDQLMLTDGEGSGTTDPATAFAISSQNQRDAPFRVSANHVRRRLKRGDNVIVLVGIQWRPAVIEDVKPDFLGDMSNNGNSGSPNDDGHGGAGRENRISMKSRESWSSKGTFLPNKLKSSSSTTTKASQASQSSIEMTSADTTVNSAENAGDSPSKMSNTSNKFKGLSLASKFKSVGLAVQATHKFAGTIKAPAASALAGSFRSSDIVGNGGSASASSTTAGEKLPGMFGPQVSVVFKDLNNPEVVELPYGAVVVPEKIAGIRLEFNKNNKLKEHANSNRAFKNDSVTHTETDRTQVTHIETDRTQVTHTETDRTQESSRSESKESKTTLILDKYVDAEPTLNLDSSATETEDERGMSATESEKVEASATESEKPENCEPKSQTEVESENLATANHENALAIRGEKTSEPDRDEKSSRSSRNRSGTLEAVKEEE